MISEYIKTAGEVFMNMQRERDVMKQVELSKRVTSELLGRMYYEAGFLESTQLNIIKRELTHPTFDYNAPNSLWELYQFVTYSQKELHPSLWMQEHIDSHKFFVRESGLIIPNIENIQIPEIIEDKLQLSLYDEFDKVEQLQEV
jgi:hypothetical protein